MSDYVGSDIACVLVATRCGASNREVTTADALAFAHSIETPLIELTSLDKQNVERIFKLLADMMVNRNIERHVDRNSDNNDISTSIRLRAEQPNNSNCCS